MGYPAQQNVSPFGPGHQSTNLADILERVLDRGLVIAGDIQVNLLDIELLTLKLRLVIASVDTARQLGIDWWTTDPWLSSTGRREVADRGGERGEPQLGYRRERPGRERLEPPERERLERRREPEREPDRRDAARREYEYDEPYERRPEDRPRRRRAERSQE